MVPAIEVRPALKRLADSKSPSQELTLHGERLHYELLSGVGPTHGWVSTTLQGRALMEKVRKHIFRVCRGGGSLIVSWTD